MGIEHSKHVYRVFLLLIIVVAGAMIGRILLVPESFGRYGFYRGDDIAEQAAVRMRHGGNESCVPCHAAIKGKHDGGPHLLIPCEDCHDALAAHVQDGKKIAEMRRTKSVTQLCARCHRELVARRKDFPQVNIEKHVQDQGAVLSETVCFGCHNPHHPTPP